MFVSPFFRVPIFLIATNIFKHVLFKNHFANQTQILYGDSLGGATVYTNMATTPIYGKKNF